MASLLVLGRPTHSRGAPAEPPRSPRGAAVPPFTRPPKLEPPRLSFYPPRPGCLWAWGTTRWLCVRARATGGGRPPLRCCTACRRTCGRRTWRCAATASRRAPTRPSRSSPRGWWRCWGRAALGPAAAWGLMSTRGGCRHAAWRATRTLRARRGRLTLRAAARRASCAMRCDSAFSTTWAKTTRR